MLVIGIVFAESLVLMLSIYVVRRKYGKFATQFQLLSGCNYLKQSAPIGLGVVFSVLYFRLDTVMLQLMTDERTVGFYNAAYKLFELVVVLPHSLMIVLFPRLVEEFHNEKEKFKVSLKKALVVYVGVGSIIALAFFNFSFETIDLIRKAEVAAPNVGFVYPFKGTKLRDNAIKSGAFDPGIEIKGVPQYSRDRPVIKNKNITGDEYAGLYRTFMFYCKFFNIQ